MPQHGGPDDGLELTEVHGEHSASTAGHYRDDPSSADAFSNDDDEEVGFSYRPAVQRQNRFFFGISLLFLALAAVVYFAGGGREQGVVAVESSNNDVAGENDAGETSGQIRWKNGERVKGRNHHPWAPWNKHRNGPLGG